MSISKERIENINKYNKEHYSRIGLYMDNELKEQIKEKAGAIGLSLNEYIKMAIMHEMNMEYTNTTNTPDKKEEKPRKKNPKELDFPESDEPYQPQGYLEQWAEVQKELKKKREQVQIDNEDNEDEKPRKVNFDF